MIYFFMSSSQIWAYSPIVHFSFESFSAARPLAALPLVHSRRLESRSRGRMRSRDAMSAGLPKASIKDACGQVAVPTHKADVVRYRSAPALCNYLSSRLPKNILSGGLIGHPSGIRHKLHRHPPGRGEIDPMKPCRRSLVHQRRFTKHIYTMPPKMDDRSVQIGDIEPKVMATDIAILRSQFILVLNVIFEQFNGGTVAALQHAKLFDRRPSIYSEVLFHPIIV